MDVGKIESNALRQGLVEKGEVVEKAAVEVVARTVNQILVSIRVMSMNMKTLTVVLAAAPPYPASPHFLIMPMEMTCLMMGAALVEVCTPTLPGGIVVVGTIPVMKSCLKLTQTR